MHKKAINRVKIIINEAKKQGISLQKRLLGLFLLFIITIMTSILLILILSGIFTVGLRGQKTLLDSELSYISNNIYNDFGEISVKSVSLSKSLSILIENYLLSNNMTLNELNKYPGKVNEILSAVFPSMQLSLERVKSSGVFIILDTTINPTLNNATFSKAGLFIKNMEPNIVNSSSPYTVVLRGPSSIAKENKLTMHSQWNLEFNIKNADYYELPLKAAKNYNVPLSRLYYWSEAINLPNVSETVMLCSVPLISSDGTPYGVCGFEVSNMLFKLTNSPDNSSYNRMLCMLSPVKNSNFHVGDSLYTCGNSQKIMSSIDTLTPVKNINSTFYTYKLSDGNDYDYAGLHKFINLYPNNSVFSSNEWVVSLLMPKEDLIEKISGENLRLILLLVFLMITSIISSIYISKVYIKSIVNALNLVKSKELSNLPKTNIPEIDDLFEFLSKQDDQNDVKVEPNNKSIQPQNFTKFDLFVKNIDTLSKSERSVFDLYMKGYTANEIANILFLSINTIKTHNKRIYAKLEVSSRKELLVYVQMMEEML